MELQDIGERKDIETLVNAFYTKVRENPVIGFIFNDVARVDWDHHLPKMYAFWSSILLGEHSYHGNPMIKHVELSRKTELGESQFAEWIQLFNQTVDELFAGEKAEEAKIRAASIARLMLHRTTEKGQLEF
ncbi:MAG TPA: group III truncated hemoglobin [Saprospiraceae bacterium]|nr:group III truncated hemoglobin [Saprospiraceae bacterium]